MKNLTREQRRRVRRSALSGIAWALTFLVVACICGVVLERIEEPPTEETPTPAPVVTVQPEETESGEDPLEGEKIDAALVAQGYLREDVPLDYTLQDILYTACDANGIPHEVGIALIDVESEFNPAAVSPNGCYGLCQLNPKYFPTGLSDGDNIRTGIAYLGEQLERYDGVLEAAVTAYNAGHDTGKRFYASQVLAAAEWWKE